MSCSFLLLLKNVLKEFGEFKKQYFVIQPRYVPSEGESLGGKMKGSCCLDRTSHPRYERFILSIKVLVHRVIQCPVSSLWHQPSVRMFLLTLVITCTSYQYHFPLVWSRFNTNYFHRKILLCLIRLCHRNDMSAFPPNLKPLHKKLAFSFGLQDSSEPGKSWGWCFYSLKVESLSPIRTEPTKSLQAVSKLLNCFVGRGMKN